MQHFQRRQVCRVQHLFRIAGKGRQQALLCPGGFRQIARHRSVESGQLTPLVHGHVQGCDVAVPHKGLGIGTNHLPIHQWQQPKTPIAAPNAPHAICAIVIESIHQGLCPFFIRAAKVAILSVAACIDLHLEAQCFQHFRPLADFTRQIIPCNAACHADQPHRITRVQRFGIHHVHHLTGRNGRKSVHPSTYRRRSAPSGHRSVPHPDTSLPVWQIHGEHS